MTTIATPAVRSARPQDSIEDLFAKIIETLAQISNEKIKDMIYGWAIKAKDNENRSAMVQALGYARKVVREQAEEAASRQRYIVATAPVREAWAAAQEAWLKWVAAEKAKNPQHQAQEAISREFWMRYADLDVRIASLWEDGPEAIPGVIDDVETLVSDVAIFYVGNWCRNCGTRIPMVISPKSGGKPFEPTLCVPCKRAELALAEELAELEPVAVEKHRVKKAGSAARRSSDGPRTKNTATDGGKGQGKKGGKGRN